jgi:ribosomal 30S subunit maturation factor RimM
VKDIVSGGAGELLVIAVADGREHLVPFVEAMVDTTRVSSGRIDIDPVEGLLD